MGHPVCQECQEEGRDGCKQCRPPRSMKCACGCGASCDAHCWNNSDWQTVSCEHNLAVAARTPGGPFEMICVKCNEPAREIVKDLRAELLSLRATFVAMQQELDTLKQTAEILAECEASAPKEIIVGPTAAAWTAIDDDDWNGATFANWLSGLDGYLVVLVPDLEKHSVQFIERVRDAVRRSKAREIRIAWHWVPKL